MPKPNRTTFNSTGFSARRVTSRNGYSLLSTSPFRSDGEAWEGGAREIEPDRRHTHMGWVKSKPDANGRRHKFYIRIACEHAAENSADDCRFGCEDRAQRGAFTP